MRVQYLEIKVLFDHKLFNDINHFFSWVFKMICINL